MPKQIGLPKVRFRLQNSTHGKYLVLRYQYAHGVEVKYSVGAKVAESEWDAQKQRAIQKTKFGGNLELNARLNRLEQACLDIYMENNRGKISPEDFRKALAVRIGDAAPEKVNVPQPSTFLEFINEYYLERTQRPGAKKGTLEVLHRVKIKIEDYARDRRCKLEFSEINEAFYRDFYKWLHALPSNLSINYVGKTFEVLKQYVREAESKNLHTDRFYINFRLPKTTVVKITLTFEQLERLNALNLSDTPHLEKTRDLFLIGAYTGLRYSDFTRIRPEHITDHKGEKLIVLTTQKTSQMVSVPLHPVLDAVLSKYGYTSPNVVNQRMNRYLKDLGQMIGLTEQKMINKTVGGKRLEVKKYVWEMLTTHVARRSFATNYYQEYPTLINSIMQITGHSTEQAFRKYIVTDKYDSAAALGKAIVKSQ